MTSSSPRSACSIHISARRCGLTCSLEKNPSRSVSDKLFKKPRNFAQSGLSFLACLDGDAFGTGCFFRFRFFVMIPVFICLSLFSLPHQGPSYQLSYYLFRSTSYPSISNGYRMTTSWIISDQVTTFFCFTILTSLFAFQQYEADGQRNQTSQYKSYNR